MTTGDMAISIGGLVISGLTIISSSLVAVFQPIHNHKKTKSHDKQWDVISEIYKKLADTDLDISICLSPIQCKESQVDIEQKAIDSFDSFSRYYLENKIYIPETISSKIDVYIKDVKSNLLANMMAKDDDTRDPGLWYKTWEKHQKGSIAESKKEIEELFRKHLKLKNRKIEKRDVLRTIFSEFKMVKITGWPKTKSST